MHDIFYILYVIFSGYLDTPKNDTFAVQTWMAASERLMTKMALMAPTEQNPLSRTSGKCAVCPYLTLQMLPLRCSSALQFESERSMEELDL